MESLDILTELTTSSATMILSMAQMTNTDMVTVDTEMIAQAAINTVATVKDAVDSVISNAYPFLMWIHKLISLAIITIIVVIIIIVGIRIYQYTGKQRTGKNIAKFLASVKTSEQANNQTTQEIREENCFPTEMESAL
jgi:hypothetical protein